MAGFDNLDDDDFSITASLRTEDTPTRKKTPASTPAKTPRNRPARRKSDPTPEPAPGPQADSPADRGNRTDEPLRPTGFNISHELVGAFREHRDRHNWQGGQVVIAAIEATFKSGALREALAAATADVTVGGDLFEAVANKHTFRDGLRRVDVQLKPSHFAVLDQLVESLGAEDRSQLVDAALRAYLTPDTQGDR